MSRHLQYFKGLFNAILEIYKFILYYRDFIKTGKNRGGIFCFRIGKEFISIQNNILFIGVMW